MRCSVIAKVVIDKTVTHFDKLFDYYVPDSLVGICKPGCRVTVPFGRSNTKRLGLVTEVGKGEVTEKIKPITSVLDREPILNEEMLGMVLRLKETTYCTYFDAVKCILPTGINLKLVAYYTLPEQMPPEFTETLSGDAALVVSYLKKAAHPVTRQKLLADLGFTEDSVLLESLSEQKIIIKYDEAVRNMTDATVNMVRIAEGADSAGVKLTPKQRSVMELLGDITSASVKEVIYFTGVTTAVITGLQKKGLLEVFPMEVFRNPYQGKKATEKKTIRLTDEQQAVFTGLLKQYKSGKSSAALLYGVTGSGKTSVFLKLVDEVISEGRSVIVMVPEISLTPQTLSQFHARYGDKVAVFHSAMSLGQRMDEWKRANSGQATVAIGTRSAVFSPLKNIGLIIMDEEQEHTYKSEQSPRFHAKDLAKYRCTYHNALLLLASATPSFESYSAAMAGRYSFYKLTKRYGNAVLPNVVTVDMRGEALLGNMSPLSTRLTNELRTTIENGKQAILLLNRRGHNTYVSCPSCGHVMNCENCSISLTYHSANKRLMCHYCGSSEELPEKCPNCGNTHMRYSGLGTQKIEEELAAILPDARVLRLDADSTMTRDAFEKGLSEFAAGKFDIMLGTQMVAKGLDFPKVTLVGVLTADQAMFSDDFRAYERAFSLLTQVIGRSGRGDFPGLAIVQTITPESEVIRMAAAQDYEQFYNSEILTRKLMVYPPYCDMVMIGVVAESSVAASDASLKLFELIKKYIGAEYKDIKLIILGPSPASVPKVNMKYRYRMIIKCKNNARFREMMHLVLNEFYQNAGKGLSVFVDVNPESII